MTNERKYFIKAAFRTNLASMCDKLHCLMYDMEEGKCDTVEVMGKVYDIDTISDLINECSRLLSASSGKVTGKEYGRIKEISEARDMMRYKACINSGMSEKRASQAFFG